MRARLLLPVVIASTVVAVAPVAGATSPHPDTRQAPVADQRLARAVIPGLDRLRPTGTVAAGTPMQIGVGLAHRDPAGEQRLFRAVTTPGSPDYRHFPTPAEYVARFAVDQATYVAAVRALTAHGLQVAYATPTRDYVLLKGSAAQVERTFDVHLATYRLADGTTFRANVDAPLVPPHTVAVLGLENLSDAHLPTATAHTHQTGCDPAGAIGCAGVVTPQDLWSVYDQPTSNRGLGQTAAIFGEGHLDDSKIGPSIVDDLRIFEAHHNLPQVPVRKVFVADDQTDTTGDGEWDLDQAAVTGMAPDLAQLTYYFGQSLASASEAGIFAAWANDPQGPAQGNASFGGCESINVALGSPSVIDPILRQAATEGRTLFVSTGDTGGSCTAVTGNGFLNTGAPQAEYPATSPYVVAVGGTQLYTTGGDTPKRVLEKAWEYGGGGTSYFEPRPADQNGIPTMVGTCVASPSLSPAGAGQPCRGVPDVAAMSGDITVLEDEVTPPSAQYGNAYADVEAGNDSENGGTSLSSPLWTGMWTRIAAASAQPLGFARPLLYRQGLSAADPSDFNDIAIGTNGQWRAEPRTPVNPSGWDYTTGLGTPDVAHLMQDISGSTTAAATSNPALPAEQTAPVPAASDCVNGQYSDPAGDATGGDESVDLTALTVSYDATHNTLAFTDHVVALASRPHEPQAFEFPFSYGGISMDLLAQRDDINGENYEADQFDPQTGAGSTVMKLTGSFDDAANLVKIVLPIDGFNAALHPSTPLAAGAQLPGPSSSGDTDPGGLLTPLDYLTTGCVYTVTADQPTPDLPEFPAPALAGAAMAAIAGCAVVRRRRRAA